ncbi:hypothetical protein BpHYR1_011767 [Brachionus plicatilis]|uniref:Uncharacterized protein n=1 Tax=Brachionus plicatilis TaxID=10195 RepID=A0A3M7Q498_BRAPC|nr:hypothetical protein BpHYR1_011767 [Brachionus plicatilis]
MELKKLCLFRNCFEKSESEKLDKSKLEISGPFNFSHVTKITAEDLMNGNLTNVPKEWYKSVHLISR